MQTVTATTPTRRSSNQRKLYLNDCHSQLNRTQVAGVIRPSSQEELVRLVKEVKRAGKSLMPFGGQHAMGGQQFGTNGVAVDMRGVNRVLNLDPKTGIVDLEAGITWPEIMAFLDKSRHAHGDHSGPNGWAISQKQTGADDLTIGGSLAANIHGRGLRKAPIIEDIESFTMINAQGSLSECSRKENQDWFNLMIGGYGLFGLIYSVKLRLVPRRKLQRVVRSTDAGSLINAFDSRIENGFQYGDFQFQIDDQSPEFLKEGIFSCYRPVSDDVEISTEISSLKSSDWLNLLQLAHSEKSKGFQVYKDHYQRTDGAIYWSDSHQFTTYVNGYHEEIDRRLGSSCPGSEMISELYVPRDRLAEFLALAAEDLRRLHANVIYGTVRLIQPDHESYLAWARKPYACIVFNICVQHSADGISRARRIFTTLIDRALELGGSFYLTYHKFARRDQIEKAYPQFEEFLRLKRELDPDLLFQSNWWRHHESLFTNA